MSSLGPSETERQAEQAVLQAALQRGYLDPGQVDAARAWQRESPTERRLLPQLAAQLPTEQIAALRVVYQQALAAPDLDGTLAPGAAVAPTPAFGAPRQPTEVAVPQRVLRSVPVTLPRAGDTVASYTILRELARGGMGAVFVARGPAGREVALKVQLRQTRGNDRQRFEVEAEATARLAHPGIVRVHAYGVDEQNRAYLVMELVEGESLQTRINREERIEDVREAARLARDMATALSYAHGQGVLHRDLKPANVLLTPDGQARITDFGLARIVDQTQALTQTGQVVGTPAFMPPEQARGQIPKMGPGSDVYSVGATLHSMLTGGPPFEEGDLLSLIVAVCQAEPEPPSAHRSDVPPELDAIVLHCLEKQPGDRYATATELAADLNAFLTGAPIRAPRRSGLRSASRLLRRHGAKVAALLFVLACAGLVAVSFLRADPAPPARTPATTPPPSADDPPEEAGPLTGDGVRDIALPAGGEQTVACQVSPPAVHAALTLELRGATPGRWQLCVDTLRDDGTWDVDRYRTAPTEGSDRYLLLHRDAYPPLPSGHLRVRVLGPGAGKAKLAVSFLSPDAADVSSDYSSDGPLPEIDDCFSPELREQAHTLSETFMSWQGSVQKEFVVDEDSEITSNAVTYNQDETLAAVEALAKRDPSPRAKLYAACLSTRRWRPRGRQWTAAGKVARGLAKSLPQDPYVNWLVGREAFERKNWERAVKNLRVFVAREPHWKIACINLGQALNRLGRFAEAQEAMLPMLAHDPFSSLGQIVFGYQELCEQPPRWERGLGRIFFGISVRNPTWRASALRDLGTFLGHRREAHPEQVSVAARRLLDVLEPHPRETIRSKWKLKPMAYTRLELTRGRCLGWTGDPARGLAHLEDLLAEVRRRKWFPRNPPVFRDLRAAIQEQRALLEGR